MYFYSMKVLKQLLSFYVNSSIHVAFSVLSLTWITLLEFQIPNNINVLLFVFFATITGYNFVKYFGIAKFHHRSLTNWLKSIQIFSFFCFLLMAYYGLQLSLKTLYYIGAFGLVTFLYAIPFLPKRLFLDKQKNLRSIVGLKIYLIALVWSGVTVFLPLIEAEASINETVLICALQRFIFVVVLMLPFEIRDLQFDSLKLSTVPQQIGVKATKTIGGFLIFGIYILDYFKSHSLGNDRAVLLFVLVLLFLFLIFARVRQGKYYSAFWVEGIPIFWLLLSLVF